MGTPTGGPLGPFQSPRGRGLQELAPRCSAKPVGIGRHPRKHKRRLAQCDFSSCLCTEADIWMPGKGCRPRGALETHGACAFGAVQAAPVRRIELRAQPCSRATAVWAGALASRPQQARPRIPSGHTAPETHPRHMLSCNKDSGPHKPETQMKAAGTAAESRPFSVCKHR